MSVAQEKFNYLLPEEQPRHLPAPRRGLSKQAIRKGKIMLTSCIFALFITGVVIASYYAQVAAVGYKIGQLQNELAQLQAEQEDLESHASQLMSLQRVEAIATAKLGMVKPNPKEVVLVAALPENPPPPTNLLPDAPVQGKDKLPQPGESKSPVIGAFVDIVSRWEKKF